MMKRFRIPSPALILSVIAVVLALTGTAVAAKLGLNALTDGAKNKTVGVGKLTYVNTTTNGTAGDQAVTPALCPEGLNVIGGGIKLSAPGGPGGLPGTSFVLDSHPTHTGWAGQVHFGAAATQTATTTAICAKSRAVTGTPSG